MTGRTKTGATHMQVEVQPPAVRGGRVRFAWDQDVPSTTQLAHRWTIRYIGVPLRRVLRRTTRALLYDVLLSVQLPLWLHDADTVTVVLPEHVPQARLDFWRAYHDADGVTFEVPPEPDHGAEAPLASEQRPLQQQRRVAVTFGGGKDSTLALEVLRLKRSASQVMLLHAIHPQVPGWRAMVRAVWRSVRHIVAPPALRQRAPVQLAVTDHICLRTAAAPGPHINIYGPVMLPALIHRRVQDVVFSNSVMGYRVTPRTDGSLRFTNPTGRPERLDHLRDYLEQEVGWGVQVECTHRAIVEYLSYGVLKERFPEAFEKIVMCPRYRASGRFCADCSKCLEFTVFGLSTGYATPDLDYSRLFESDRVERIAARARELVDVVAPHGNGPYDRAIGTATHFAGWCHALSKIDMDGLPVALTPRALENLQAIVAVWGRQPFGAVQRVDPEAVAACGPYGTEVAAVVAASQLVAEAPPSDGILLVGDTPAEFDHTARMPTPALDAWAERWLTTVPSSR
ncbi:hypothetical protein [Pseudactinotalea sp.]|uniref:hypothetical protein n=1 Tax=Pseudactinotalea sp. TaxID=1926260 RepID=UPI003B3B603C